MSPPAICKHGDALWLPAGPLGSACCHHFDQVDVMINDKALCCPSISQYYPSSMMNLPEKQKQSIDKVPATVATIATIHEANALKTTYLSLFDSGGSHTLINKRALPPGIQPLLLNNTKKFSTTARTMQIASMVKLENITFPLFTKTKHVPDEWAYIFDNIHIPYDVIIG